MIALGNVVRVEALASGLYDVGICLAGIDDGHQMAVERFINERLKEIARGEKERPHDPKGNHETA